MVHASLFSGKGGFDLAADWMGWETAFQCEINPFTRHILQYYWPDAELFNDITKTDFTKYYGKIDVLSGGFPCQPYSVAGQRRGKEDDRHLWPEMLRAIREIRPTWVVGENVRGLISWSEGLVFDEVQSDLEAAGYEILPFLLPAVAVNAPHRRDRIWFVAHLTDTNAGLCEQQDGQICAGRSSVSDGSNTGSTADTRGTGQQERYSASESESESESERYAAGIHTPYRTDWQDFPTQSPVCVGDDGLSSRLDAAAVFGKPCRPKGARTFGAWRNKAIIAGGNAIVPQVALQIFDAIDLYETLYA